MASSRSWGIGEFADLPALARWMRGAGLRVLQVLPLNEMAPGQASPYSAVSAMALDPIFICVPDVPDFHELGGEDALDTAARGLLDHARASRAVDYWGVRTLKDRALRSAFRRFLRHEWAAGSERATAPAGLHPRPGLVARRLRALPGGAARHGWPAVDRVAGGAQPPRAGGHLQVPAGVLAGGSVPPVPAVDRARAVGRRTTALGGPARLRRLPVRRCRRKRRRVGEPGPLLVRRVGGRAARCVQRGRPELAIARLSLGRDARARLRVVRRPRATGVGPVRPLPRGSRRRTLQVVGLPARRPGGSLRTRGRGGAGCAGRSRAARDHERRRRGHRRGSRHDPGLRAGHDDRAGPARLPGDALGAVLGRARPAVRQSRRVSAAIRGDHGHARHRDPRGLVADRRRSGAAGRADGGRHGVAGPGAAGRCRRCAAAGRAGRAARGALRLGSDLLTLPIQDVFGWPDRINVPAVIDDTNWTWRLPWPVDALDDQPEAAERQRALRRWSERHARA